MLDLESGRLAVCMLIMPMFSQLNPMLVYSGMLVQELVHCFIISMIVLGIPAITPNHNGWKRLFLTLDGKVAGAHDALT